DIDEDARLGHVGPSLANRDGRRLPPSSWEGGRRRRAGYQPSESLPLLSSVCDAPAAAPASAWLSAPLETLESLLWLVSTMTVAGDSTACVQPPAPPLAPAEGSRWTSVAIQPPELPPADPPTLSPKMTYCAPASARDTSWTETWSWSAS